VLRRLAGRVAELAAREIEQEKKTLWTRHNDRKPARPLEIIMKDNHTIRNDSRRATERVRIVREEIDRRA